MEPSSTNRLLEGRTIDGSTSPVKTVLAKGNLRTIQFENGEVRRTTKAVLTKIVAETVADEYRLKSQRSVRTRPDGSVGVTLGGPERGERKVYASKAAAKAAITRYYGKAK